MVAIRGAITCENTQNSISAATVELMTKIFDENKITIAEVASVIFSVTKDLNSFNPATAFRNSFSAADTPLFCVQEAEFNNSLPFCLRVLVFIEGNFDKSSVCHCYLRNAKVLRPDLQK